MAACVLVDTLTDGTGGPAAGVEVVAELFNYANANRVVNTPAVTRTNQQGTFRLKLVQGVKMRIVIRDLGIDIAATIPATATTTLTDLMAP